MPNLTTKELTALEEQLGTEQVVIKKYRTLSQQCTDQALKTRLESIMAIHQHHYDKLLTHLK